MRGEICFINLVLGAERLKGATKERGMVKGNGERRWRKRREREERGDGKIKRKKYRTRDIKRENEGEKRTVKERGRVSEREIW